MSRCAPKMLLPLQRSLDTTASFTFTDSTMRVMGDSIEGNDTSINWIGASGPPAHEPSSCLSSTSKSDQNEFANESTTVKLRKSCNYCVRMKRACNGKTPCVLCLRRKKDCIRSAKKKSGPAKGSRYSSKYKGDFAATRSCMTSTKSRSLAGSPPRSTRNSTGFYHLTLDSRGHQHEHRHAIEPSDVIYVQEYPAWNQLLAEDVDSAQHIQEYHPASPRMHILTKGGTEDVMDSTMPTHAVKGLMPDILRDGKSSSPPRYHQQSHQSSCCFNSPCAQSNREKQNNRQGNRGGTTGADPIVVEPHGPYVLLDHQCNDGLKKAGGPKREDRTQDNRLSALDWATLTECAQPATMLWEATWRENDSKRIQDDEEIESKAVSEVLDAWAKGL